MAKMRGFLHSKPKIDDAEWAIAQSRTAERLAGLFSDAALDGTEEPARAETEAPVDGQAVPPADPAEAPVLADVPATTARPPIVIEVLGATGENEIEAVPLEPVGVMAQPGDRFDDDGWQLPTPSPVTPAGLPTRTRAPRRPSSAKPARATAPAQVRAKAARATAPAQVRAKPRPKRRPAPQPAPVAVAHCPYCAVVLEPAPTASRRCDRCRQRIMVKRVDGHPVYLTEAAVAIFEAERRRVASSARLTRERGRWLGLAATAGAPERRHAQLAAARLSEDSVVASRALYLTAVDRSFRAARREKAWDAAARIRREQATVLYRAAGSHRPPPADLVALYREGVAAELRGIAEMSRDAELVAASCCDACRADHHRIFRISAELRQPRLPHADCPRGLCRCHWDLAARDRRTMQRYLRRRPAADASSTPDETPTPA